MQKMQITHAHPKRSAKTLKTSFIAALAAIGLMSTPASSDSIPFSIIGPHEYDFPVNFDPFHVFVAYGEYNHRDKQFDGSGNLVDAPGQNLYSSITKYVYFTTLPGAPHIGSAWEIIVPEVALWGGRSRSVSGIADPLFGALFWIKPNKHSTLGGGGFVQVPMGNSEVSSYMVQYWPEVFFDYQLSSLSFTSDFGAVVRSTQDAPGQPRIQPGTTYFANLRLGWVNSSIIEPFIAFDWQTTDSSYEIESGLASAPGSDEIQLGAGLMFKFDKNFSLSMNYARSVSGKNTFMTDEGRFRLIRVF